MLDPSLMLLEIVKEKIVRSLTYNLNAFSVLKKPRNFYYCASEKEWWFCWSKSIVVLNFIHVDKVLYDCLLLDSVGVPDKLLKWDWGSTTQRKRNHSSSYTLSLCLRRPFIWRNLYLVEIQVTVKWQAESGTSYKPYLNGSFKDR